MRGLPEADLESFYLAAYPRLVAALCVTADDRADAEDAAQEAFTRLLRSHRWSSITTPEAWLYTVGLNVLRSRWRKRTRTRERAHLLPLGRHLEGSQELSTDSLDVRHALRELPPRYRDPLVMFYLLDLPIGQIAEETGLNVGTVKSQLSRGRKLLADRLAEVTSR